MGKGFFIEEVSMLIWIVKKSGDKQVTGTKVASSNPKVMICKTAKEAAETGLNSFHSFDVYQGKVNSQGDIISEKKIISSYPGIAPDDWFPHKYGPSHQNYAPSASIFVNQIPAGVADSIRLFEDPKVPSKPANTKRFEIEMALLESDLPASTVDEAMELLPNIERLYEFLEERNQKKVLHLIHRLLSW